MAETKKTEAAAAAAPPEAACLTLRQKLVEMRKACPEIVKKQHSDGVSYKYAKIYDVWEKITPIMNELGVDFDVISEQATRHAENGDPVYWITMQTKTRNGDKLMFLYEADLTIRWLNLDNDDETIEATVHAVGWNDDPAKAKGAAHTYALKYYLFEKFTVDQGEDDPDNSDFGAQGKGSGADRRAYPHKLANAIIAYDLTGKVQNSHRAIDDVLALFEVLKAMDDEREDLGSYVNLFGYNPKYGVSGRRIVGVRYEPQSFSKGLTRPEQTLPARAARR